MTKRRLSVLWWSLVALYVVFIYMNLSAMPLIWKRFNLILGGRGLMVQYLIYAISGLSLIYYVTLIKRERSLKRYILMAVCACAFFVMVQFEKNAGEKIHMVMYGALGVLLYNALRQNFDRLDLKLYLWGSLACGLIGCIDEIIQGILPGRFFTWHDVCINGLSGIMVLILIRFNILNS
ncbi:VanZ family protein [Candidatus Omnitrophota bacterium]